MSNLDDMIELPANLEMKRALAVKMILFEFKTEAICALLNVSDACVSKWKIRFDNEGVEALKLNYKGGKGFLTADQRDEILFYLSRQPHYSVEALRDYLEYHQDLRTAPRFSCSRISKPQYIVVGIHQNIRSA